MTGPPPRSGTMVWLTQAASPQFFRPIPFRVIRRLDWDTYDGWTWLDGYQLDDRGDAVERRSVFVRPDGLSPWAAPPRGRARHRP